MTVAPNTWNVLQAIQYQIATGVQVSGSSPFSAWSPNDPDATRFATNPYGTIANAVYVGVPKDWQSSNLYSAQCHIIPPPSEEVYRRTLGGKMWDWTNIVVMFWFSRVNDWYGTMQTLIAARDSMYVLMGQHAEMPNALTAVASDIKVGTGAVGGYGVNNVIGSDWDSWGFTWRVKQEWNVPGGFIS